MATKQTTTRQLVGDLFVFHGTVHHLIAVKYLHQTKLDPKPHPNPKPNFWPSNSPNLNPVDYKI